MLTRLVRANATRARVRGSARLLEATVPLASPARFSPTRPPDPDLDPLETTVLLGRRPDF